VAGWTQQLQGFHERSPVYAVISGAGGAQWAPVRDFCELSLLPCRFPIVDYAPARPDDHFVIYGSRGVPLEARILARLLTDLEPRPARVVQIVGNDAGTEAARLLSGMLEQTACETRVLTGDSATGVLAGLSAKDVVVGWLTPAQLQLRASARPEGPGTSLAIFSAQLAPPDKTRLPEAWRRDSRWISVRSDPGRLHGRGALGLVPWLQQLKLAPGETALLAEVYAATYYFGDALARMRGHWSQEFLLESLESASYGRPAASVYFSPSLGPGQREAAKAGHLLGFSGADLRELIAIGPRLAP
jgi:hypothetical protein